MNAGPTVTASLYALCEAFDAEWSAGTRPRIEEFLKDVPRAKSEVVLSELIALDLGWRRRRGEEPTSAEYAERFPEHSEAVNEAFRACLASTVIRNADSSTSLAPHDANAPRWNAAFARGTRFADYEIEAEIARGGMGVVYRARQISLNRPVALKMILSAHLASPADLSRFRIEAEAAAQLDHPGIVPVYEFGERDGQHYLSMALVTGGTLAALTKQGPIEPRRTAALVRRLAEAVQYAHSKNIVHRDLKPGNVLLDEAGQPKITDFGLAKNVVTDSGMTATGEIIGTPSYMAPEQAAGRIREVGPLADVYALGAILYYLLTGNPPFRGESIVETLQLVTTQEPVSPRQINSKVDVDLATICLKCLAKEPGRRYASASELAAELTSYLEDRPIAARPPSRGERAWRWCRRNPLLVALLTTAAAVFVASSVGLYYRSAMHAARTAEAAARTAEDAAHEVARAQQYYGALNAVRKRAIERNPGWSWQCLDDLRQASVQRPSGTSAAEMAELRSLATECLTAGDLRHDRLLLPEVDVADLAFSADGRWLAVAEDRAGQSSSVHFVDLQEQAAAARSFTAGNLLSNLGRILGGTSKYHDALRALALSADGRWLAAGSRYGMVHVWDTSLPGRDAMSWSTGDGQVQELAFVPDGSRLLSHLSESAQVQIWDAERHWECAATIDVKQRASAMAPTADGTRIVVVGERVEVLSLEGAVLVSVPHLTATGVTTAHHSQMLAAAQGAQVHLIDGMTGVRLRTLADPDAENSGFGEGIRFSPEDDCVAAVGSDEIVRLWDTASGELLQTFPISKARTRAIEVHPSGDRVAVGTSQGTELLVLRDGDLLQTVGYHAAPIQSADWLPDSQHVMSGCVVDQGNVQMDCFGVWDISTQVQTTGFQVRNVAGDPSFAWPMQGEGSCVVHPREDSAIIAGRHLGACEFRPSAAGGRSLRVLSWPALGDAVVIEPNELGAGATMDPIASDGQAVRLGGIDGQRSARLSLKSVQLPEGTNWFQIVASIRATGVPDNGTAFIIDNDCSNDSLDRSVPVRRNLVPQDSYGELWLDSLSAAAHLRDNGTFDVVLRLPSEAASSQEVWINRVLLIPSGQNAADDRRADAKGPFCFSPTGEHLWGLYGNRNVACWGYPALDVRSQWANPVSGVLDGDDILYSVSVSTTTAAIGARKGIVYLLSVADGKLQGVIEGPGGAVRSLAFDPTGRRLSVGSELGGIRIVNMEATSQYHELREHSRSVESLNYSADGELLASGSRDGSVRLWGRVGEEFRPILTIANPHRAVQTVRFDAAGSRLLVVNQGESAARIWDIGRLRRELAELQLDW